MNEKINQRFFKLQKYLTKKYPEMDAGTITLYTNKIKRFLDNDIINVTIGILIIVEFKNKTTEYIKN